MITNKHYIRLDVNKSIVKGFSDAFESPIAGDICINEDGIRHFELEGVVNPALFNENNQPLYKWWGGRVVVITEVNKNLLYPIPIPEIPLEIRNRADIDYLAMMGGIEL